MIEIILYIFSIYHPKAQRRKFHWVILLVSTHASSLNRKVKGCALGVGTFTINLLCGRILILKLNSVVKLIAH
jgi:hypothetical protein